jgi:uncharacterized coiled-coil DUF342 family protein
MSDALVWGLIVLLGVWGTMLLKHWLDERTLRRRLLEQALYLRGKIAGLRSAERRNPAREIQEFIDSLGRRKGDPGYIKSMIGYLEQYAEDAEELKDEYKSLSRQINEWRRGALILRQQIIDAGETPPKLPDELEKDLAAYSAMIQKIRTENREVAMAAIFDTTND